MQQHQTNSNDDFTGLKTTVNITNACNAPYVYPFGSQPPPAPPLPPLSKQVKASLSDLQARAKTVRIGKVRWPPPLRESETFENELQRRLELQRKIHEEILTSSECKSPAVPVTVSAVGKLDMSARQPLCNSTVNQQHVNLTESKLVTNVNIDFYFRD